MQSYSVPKKAKTKGNEKKKCTKRGRVFASEPGGVVMILGEGSGRVSPGQGTQKKKGIWVWNWERGGGRLGCGESKGSAFFFFFFLMSCPYGDILIGLSFFCC